MRITLQIENVDKLKTGGQVSFSCADRGFDIGRHEHLDWSLPDPQRVVSGKHCEVRYEGGQFVLYDVSTNGTFLNGSPNRLDRPHPMRSGDRLMIGDYLIRVSLDADSVLGAPPPAQPAGSSSPWETSPAPSSAPGWPSAPQAPSNPYPDPGGAGGMWPASGPGMEGRHAPPSSAPGIGTPEDDVWGQGSHGWGNSDPGLYDTTPVAPAEPVRPMQADPLDRLADQPVLHRSEPQPAFDPPVQPAPVFAPPEATDTGDRGLPEPEKPLFGMPDFAEPAAEQPEAPAVPAEPSAPAEPPMAASSPFPEAPARAPVEEAPAPSPFGEAPDSPPPAMERREGTLAAPQALEPAQAVAPPPVESSPPPVSAPVPVEPVAAVPVAAADSTAILKAFAAGAGIGESVLADRDAEEFVRELGEILQSVTGDVMGLLQARSQVKAMTRNANRTLISRSGNNALKFSPTPQMALQTMFAANAEENGYLPFRQAMEAALKDIKKHHVWTYSAMQKAAGRFEDTLSPKAIEAAGPVEKGTFSNPKAKLWERMQQRWESLTETHDDGLVGLFTQYFTESYEDLSDDDPEGGVGSGF